MNSRNVNNLTLLRDTIKMMIGPSHFDYGLFGSPIALRDFLLEGLESPCGTSGCVAGWMRALFAPYNVVTSYSGIAEEHLGLTYNEFR